MLNSTNFLPVNKLLDNQWNSLQYSRHKQRLKNIKISQHSIDNNYPKQYSHLTLRLKKQQQEEEKQFEIENKNRKLINKLNRILETPSDRLDHWNDYESSTLQIINKSSPKKKELKEIERQNQILSSKLINVKSTYNINDFDLHFKRHRNIQNMLENSTKTYNYNTSNNPYDIDSDDMLDATGKNRFSLASPMPSSIGSVCDSSDKPWRKNSKQLKPATKMQQSEGDARMLMKACNHMETRYICFYNRICQTNEILIKCLVKRTPKQRQQTRMKFKALYHEELEKRLKEALGKEYFGLIEGLLQNPYTEQINKLHLSIKDVDPFAFLHQIVCFHHKSLESIEDVYKKYYSSSIDNDLADFFGDENTRNMLLAFKNGLKNLSTVDDDKSDQKQLLLMIEKMDNNNLLDSRGILLSTLSKSLKKFEEMCKLFDEQSGTDSLVGLIHKEYDENAGVVFRHILDTLSKRQHVEKIAQSLDGQINACSKRFVHDLIILSESFITFDEVNQLFEKRKHSNIHDAIINRCKSNAAPVVAAIVSPFGKKS